ncbi:MAG: hypothetical protein HUU26_12015 [Gemmatimonadaceae bacterium]|nr:hypothetical protein [Gemmatimonadaceae bacterium]
MIRYMLALGVALAPPPAAEVFGDLRIGDQYVADAALELTCGEETVKGRTDATGSFRLSAKSLGKCRLTVTHDGQTPAVDVVLFEKPARYRLVLERKGDTWTLRRV